MMQQASPSSLMLRSRLQAIPKSLICSQGFLHNSTQADPKHLLQCSPISSTSHFIRKRAAPLRHAHPTNAVKFANSTIDDVVKYASSIGFAKYVDVSLLITSCENLKNHNGLHVKMVQTIASLVHAFHRLASTGARISSTFLCNSLENLISNLHSHTLHNAQLLQGNFAPIADECPPIPCTVSAPLPAFLDGIYLRNGPNEQHKSNAPTHSSHLFDGDGMLHSVNFHNGEVVYCCRYVHTNRFVQEKAAGQALFPKIFSNLTVKERFVATAYMSLAVLRHLLGLIDVTKGMGLANTSIVFHHGKLLALGEDDLPYTLCIEDNGDLVNMGRYKFFGDRRLPKTMTSHPKIDIETGEMIFLSYNILFQPYLTFFRMSSDGTLSKGVPIDLQKPCMIHDFAITPHFIIFPETQIVFHPHHMVQGKSPIKCDPQKVQRFGVLPRNATADSELRWFDVPGCNCFHILNSWEEDKQPEDVDSMKTSLCSHDVDEIVLILANLSSPDDLISGEFDKVEGTLTEVRLNLEKGKATQSTLVDEKGNHTEKLNADMGTMNENYRGIKNRYVYMGVLGSGSSFYIRLSGLVKVDLKTRKAVARRMFDENCYASEPMFVSSINSKEAQEDDGCLLCLLHHESPHHKSTGAGSDVHDTCHMLVLDAQSPALDIIASIKLPRRVPYGFHGLFIPRNTL